MDALDREAQRLGVERQAVINFWLAERLKVN
ncbi:MAG TPA: CopG family transcriptional regulator, partial [Cyanothece sp. UBA12306]|nr:CopG family transcriptional regulator [Cyanothece sp. UBA12306]